MNDIAATQLSAEDMGDYLQVAFARDDAGMDGHVILQVAKSFDAPDRRTGMDGIYLEIDTAVQGAYRSIERIDIVGRSIAIRFDTKAHGLARDASPLNIACNDPALPFADVVAMLRQMAGLAGTPFSETVVIGIPYFDHKKLRYDPLEEEYGGPDPARAEALLQAFATLTAADRLEDLRHVHAYCQGLLAATAGEDDMRAPENPPDVWQHVQSETITVLTEDGLDDTGYVLVHAACDWDPEHGLQMVWRDGIELVRVSGIDGHPLNSAFQGSDVVYADPLRTFTTRR